jgi:hypothetical protein
MRELRIAVEIDQDGRITADADGFSEDMCLRDLQTLLDGLADWETVERKPDVQERGSALRRVTDVGRRNP